MKKFEKAEIEVISFATEDVVVASGCCPNCNLVGACVSVCQGHCVGNGNG